MKLEVKINEEKEFILYKLYGDATYIVDVFDESMGENFRELILLIKDYTPKYIYFNDCNDDTVEEVLLKLASNAILIDQELNIVSYGY